MSDIIHKIINDVTNLPHVRLGTVIYLRYDRVIEILLKYEELTKEKNK